MAVTLQMDPGCPSPSATRRSEARRHATKLYQPKYTHLASKMSAPVNQHHPLIQNADSERIWFIIFGASSIFIIHQDTIIIHHFHHHPLINHNWSSMNWWYIIISIIHPSTDPNPDPIPITDPRLPWQGFHIAIDPGDDPAPGTQGSAVRLPAVLSRRWTWLDMKQS